MAVFDGPFRRKVDRSLAHNGEVQPLQIRCDILIVMHSGDFDLTLSDEVRRKELDNTVGNWSVHFWEKYPDDCYSFGLWCADGYHRSSSIGISNVDIRLVERFRTFLQKEFPSSRFRLRIYHPYGMGLDLESYRHLSETIVSYPMRKSSQAAMQLYVNSRPLLRLMQDSRQHVERMDDREQIVAYFAGRFDGDGSVYADGKTYCRIAYSSEAEARMDQQLLLKIGITKSSVYHYKQAQEYCLYISKNIASSFVGMISQYALTTPEMHASVPVETFPALS